MKKSFTHQEKIATKELRKSSRRFKKKRVTVLVRVQKKWLPYLKEEAKSKRKTISKFLDEIYQFYFKQQADDG